MFRRLHAYLEGDDLGPVLVRSLLGSAGIRILGMGFGFLVGVQLARSLGATGYGVYGVAMSILAVLAIPVEFGMPQLVTREAAAAHLRRDNSAVGALLTWAHIVVFRSALLAAVTFGLAALLLKDVVDRTVVRTMAAGFLVVVLMPLTNIYSAAIRGYQRVVAGQVPDVLLRPAIYSGSLFAGMLLLSGGLDPEIAMWLQVTSAGAACLCAYGYVRHLRSTFAADSTTRAAEGQAREWLRSSWPLALTEAMRVVHGNAATLVLGWVSTTAAVGVFRVGSAMSALLTMPVSLVHVVLAPTITRLHAAGNSRDLQRLLGGASLMMVVCVGVLSLPFVVSGPAIHALLFGKDFSSANSTLLILSGGTAVGCIFGPGATLLNMTGHERCVTRSFALSLVVMFMLLVPLGVEFGGPGAAAATSVSFIFWSAVMWMEARKLLEIDPSVMGLVRDAPSGTRTGQSD